MCLEWWTFEMIILMTGILPEADTNLGVVGIMFQLGGLSYMVPLGLQGRLCFYLGCPQSQGSSNLKQTHVSLMTVHVGFRQILGAWLFGTANFLLYIDTRRETEVDFPQSASFGYKLP